MMGKLSCSDSSSPYDRSQVRYVGESTVIFLRLTKNMLNEIDGVAKK
jgi:hypothetical protein